MKRKLPVLLLTVCLLFGCMSMFVTAEESSDMVVLVEENFDEYEAEVNGASTNLPKFFTLEANAIGDGYIRVEEEASGNLILKSHVFSQVFNHTPITGAYEFSLSIIGAQGKVQSGVLIRAPQAGSTAYYEGDGSPDTSVCLSGIYLYPHDHTLGVNVKTYNTSAPNNVQNNTHTFQLPEGAAFGSGTNNTLKVVDNGTDEISFYVAEKLVCKVTMSDPGKKYSNALVTDPCFGTVVLSDAEGKEIATYTDTFVGSSNATIGWSTRICDMYVDNVSVKAEKHMEAILAIGSLPSKVKETDKARVEAARALYDALSEESKALVTNLKKLTSAEEALAAFTEAPTEEPTEAPTEAPTEIPTETIPEETIETMTDASTVEETNAPVTPQPQVVDDSLAIWILIAIMLVAVGITAGIVTVKVRK